MHPDVGQILRLGWDGVRVAILNITAGGMSSGYRKYLVDTIPILSSLPGVDALLCASPASLRIQEWLGGLPNVSYVDCCPYNIINHFLLGGKDKRLEKHLDKFSPDVIFIPVDRYISYQDVPVVNMVRNMEPLIGRLRGDSFRVRLKKWIQYIDVKRAVKKSDGVIAISNFVRDFLINRWNIPHKKITLVYHGNNVPVQTREEDAPPNIPVDWKGKFIFTLGSIRPARGLEDILGALKHLARGPAVKGLVIAGDTSTDMVRYRRKLERWINNQDLSSRVCWTGNLSENQVAWCYKNCLVFVMTSRVESFGLVALEAMSNGCISIAANNPCLPEIFGDTAVFYPPADCKSLSEKLREVLRWSDQEKQEVSTKARLRASRFSWETNAIRTMEALTRTVEASKRSNVRKCHEVKEVKA